MKPSIYLITGFITSLSFSHRTTRPSCRHYTLRHINSDTTYLLWWDNFKRPDLFWQYPFACNNMIPGISQVSAAKINPVYEHTGGYW